MDLKKATTLASVTVMTFMLAGGYFVKVKKQSFQVKFKIYTINFLHIQSYSKLLLLLCL